MSKSIDVLYEIPCIKKKKEECHDKESIRKILKDGHIIICADNINKNIAIKYAFTIIDEIIYTFKLSDSTEREIVFTLEQANKMTTEYFEIFFEKYLKNCDILFVDQDNLLEDAEAYFGDFTHDEIKKDLDSVRNGKGVRVFNDPLSPINFKN